MGEGGGETMTTETWRTVPFTCACRDTTGGQKKVQKRAYLASGEYPIVDQGQQLIAGYTNKPGELYTGQLPAVLFGDHTRVFKYVDFPFALGADGVKALTSSNGIDPKYLYYYFQTVSIPSRGYSRHFKILKQTRVRVPPPSEQRRIVEILDQADALRKKRTEADKIADRILPALFYKMFGDPATNPKGWDMEPLGELGELDRGRSRHRPRNDPRLLGGPYPFIQTGDVAGAHGYIRTHTATYSEFGLSQSRMWPAGTLCITIAANIAAAAILGFDACFPDSVVGFTSGPRTNAAFVRVLLGFLRPILESFAPQMAQKNINLKILRDIKVPVPPKELQDKFAEEHDCVVSMADNARRAADRLETLFTVLLHRAFSGGLTAKWREAHMKELLQEMDQQAKALDLDTKG